MADLITQLAEFRERQGLAPMPDPRFIQGFEPGSPPAPPFPTFTTPAPTYQEPFVDDDEPETYRSPLVEAAIPAEAPRTAPPPALPPDFELVICDTAAAYRGHAVELNQQERNAVVSVVLEALGRALAALRSEVDGPRGTGVTPAEKAALRAPLKRRRRSRPDDRWEKEVAERIYQQDTPPVKRKPGRPRKVQP